MPSKPIQTEYSDVNGNWIRFEGKSTAAVKIYGKRNNLEFLVTTKKTNPLLGLDWMEKIGITLDTGSTDSQIDHIMEDPDITVLKKKFEKLFNENRTVNGLDVKIQIKEDTKLMQQKGRAIPIRLQQSVVKESNKLMKQGHLGKQITLTKTASSARP